MKFLKGCPGTSFVCIATSLASTMAQNWDRLERFISSDKPILIFIANPSLSHSSNWISIIQNHYANSKRIYWIYSGYKKFSIEKAHKTKKDIIYAETPKFIVFLLAIYLIKYLRSIQISTHAHYIGYPALLSLILPADKRILTSYGSDINVASYEFLKAELINFIIRNANIITYDDDRIKSRIQKFLMDSTDRSYSNTELCHLNFFIDDIHQLPDANSEKLSQLIEDGEFNILSLRNHEDIYDIRTLINAVHHIASLGFFNRKYKRVKVIIAGYGSEFSNNLRLSKEKLFDGLEVVMTGGFTRIKLLEMLKTSHLYISTSLSDSGFASSTIEALFAGLPVITSNTYSEQFLSLSNVSIETYEPADFCMLSKMIMKVANRYPYYLKKASKNKKRIYESFNKNRFLHECAKLYEP